MKRNEKEEEERIFNFLVIIVERPLAAAARDLMQTREERGREKEERNAMCMHRKRRSASFPGRHCSVISEGNGRAEGFLRSGCYSPISRKKKKLLIKTVSHVKAQTV